ncbi:pyridoxamine 5'-phosphate oxidase family protein [Vibrio sp. PP-XX7]
MPAPLAVAKEVRHIDQHTQTFIENSTLFFLSSHTQDGFLDISPRGGEAGFVKIFDEKALAFLTSPGNNRLDTLTTSFPILVLECCLSSRESKISFE